MADAVEGLLIVGACLVVFFWAIPVAVDRWVEPWSRRVLRLPSDQTMRAVPDLARCPWCPYQYVSQQPSLARRQAASVVAVVRHAAREHGKTQQDIIDAARASRRG